MGEGRENMNCGVRGLRGLGGREGWRVGVMDL